VQAAYFGGRRLRGAGAGRGRRRAASSSSSDGDAAARDYLENAGSVGGSGGSDGEPAPPRRGLGFAAGPGPLDGFSPDALDALMLGSDSGSDSEGGGSGSSEDESSSSTSSSGSGRDSAGPSSANGWGGRGGRVFDAGGGVVVDWRGRVLARAVDLPPAARFPVSSGVPPPPPEPWPRPGKALSKKQQRREAKAARAAARGLRAFDVVAVAEQLAAFACAEPGDLLALPAAASTVCEEMRKLAALHGLRAAPGGGDSGDKKAGKKRRLVTVLATPGAVQVAAANAGAIARYVTNVLAAQRQGAAMLGARGRAPPPPPPHAAQQQLQLPQHTQMQQPRPRGAAGKPPPRGSAARRRAERDAPLSLAPMVFVSGGIVGDGAPPAAAGATCELPRSTPPPPPPPPPPAALPLPPPDCGLEDPPAARAGLGAAAAAAPPAVVYERVSFGLGLAPGASAALEPVSLPPELLRPSPEPFDVRAAFADAGSGDDDCNGGGSSDTSSRTSGSDSGSDLGGGGGEGSLFGAPPPSEPALRVGHTLQAARRTARKAAKEGRRAARAAGLDPAQLAADARAARIAAALARRAGGGGAAVFSPSAAAGSPLAVAGLPARPAGGVGHAFAAFERHTRGVGSRLLEGMGWSAGEGLGRARQGISAPIQPAMRPRQLGLGADGGKF